MAKRILRWLGGVANGGYPDADFGPYTTREEAVAAVQDELGESPPEGTVGYVWPVELEEVPPKAPAPAASSELRTDGPTLEEYVAAGYDAKTYPPKGYAAKPSKASSSSSSSSSPGKASGGSAGTAGGTTDSGSSTSSSSSPPSPPAPSSGAAT